MPSRIVVIGGSAGGLDPALEVLRSLPAKINAAVFLVIHGTSTVPELLPGIVRAQTRLSVRIVSDPVPIETGWLYLPAPDRHLLVHRRAAATGSGPRENGFRPAIDPLFRTAARAHAGRVIGVILSGMGDDGALGLRLIKHRGGVAIVQDPATALYPEMPGAAAAESAVDQLIPPSAIGEAIIRVVSSKGLRRTPVMSNGKAQRDVAEDGPDGIRDPMFKGPPSKMTCPECGGVLWGFPKNNPEQYRCHTGHAFTTNGLAEHQTHSVEEALWTALRTLQQGAELRRQMAERVSPLSPPGRRQRYATEAAEMDQRAEAIRSLIFRERAPRRRRRARRRRK